MLMVRFLRFVEDCPQNFQAKASSVHLLCQAESEIVTIDR